MVRRCVGAAFALLVVVCVPAVSQAHFHLAVIDEVMTSYNGDATKQFVEIRMLGPGQIFVGGSVLAAFDAAGTYLGDVLTVGSDIATGGTGLRWIMATAPLAAAAAIVPDFTIPGPLYLPTGGGMVCWGKPTDHTNPGQYIDCVAYGTYAGPANSKIGTPTALDGDSHSLQRGGSTHNNLVDFICGDPSTPTTNAATSGSLVATTACPPTAYDAVVAVPRPMTVTIPNTATSVVKTLRVKVVNASTSSATIPISLNATGCGGFVSAATPDFKGSNQVNLAGGKAATAKVVLTISDSATSFNGQSPDRCTVTLTAQVDVPGNIEPMPDNDTAQVEVNVVDKGDPSQVATAPNHDSVIDSAGAVTVAISSTASNATKKVTLKLRNTDVGEADPGHAITVTPANVGPCTFTADLDLDSRTSGMQNPVTVAGGKLSTGSVIVTFNDTVSTPNKKSPLRCGLQLQATGPLGNVDPNPASDTTVLWIDVIDKGD